MMGQNPEVSEIAGTYICSYVPALYLLGIIDFDRVLMINLGLAMEAMYLQILAPFLHFGLCYTIAITFEGGVVGAALSGTITNTFIMFV